MQPGSFRELCDFLYLRYKGQSTGSALILAQRDGVVKKIDGLYCWERVEV